MSSAQPDISLGEWIEYCEGLSATQNFLLIGLLSKSRFTSLSILQAQPLETEENWNAAKNWVLKHLREALKIYCDNYKKHKVEIATEAGKAFGKAAKDWIANVAPAIVLTVGGVKATGVAFVIWLLKYSLDQWCSVYADKKYSGKGTYSRLIPTASFEAFFDVSYTPPIIVYSEDSDAFPLSVPKEEVRVPAETTGLIRVSDTRVVYEIYTSLESAKNHSFEFKDVKSRELVKGVVDFVLPAPEVGAHVLKLRADELEVSKS
jgi:hypothetical protein